MPSFPSQARIKRKEILLSPLTEKRKFARLSPRWIASRPESMDARQAPGGELTTTKKKMKPIIEHLPNGKWRLHIGGNITPSANYEEVIFAEQNNFIAHTNYYGKETIYRIGEEINDFESVDNSIPAQLERVKK